MTDETQTVKGGVHWTALVGTAIATILAVIAVYEFFVPSPADKNFEGLRVQASYLEDGATSISWPADYVSSPTAVFARGSVVDQSDPEQSLIAFRVRLSSDGDQIFGEAVKTLQYFDLRPVVCQAVNDGQNCGTLTIVSLSLEAEFPRGTRSDPIYGLDPIDLS